MPFKHRVAGSSPARLTNVFCELRGFHLCFGDSGTLNDSGPSLDRDNLLLQVTEFLIELRDGQAVLGCNAGNASLSREAFYAVVVVEHL
jgi:hypothetical protein